MTPYEYLEMLLQDYQSNLNKAESEAEKHFWKGCCFSLKMALIALNDLKERGTEND